MAKKKKTEQVIVNDLHECITEPVPVEPVAEPQVNASVSEPEVRVFAEEPKMITVKALSYFKDGGVREHFDRAGVPLEWKSGQVRTIPVSLYQLCKNSGGRFEVV